MLVWTLVFIANAAFAALDATLYVTHHKPTSLGAAVFCGALAVWALVQGARS